MSDTTDFTAVWRDGPILEVAQGDDRFAVRATAETGQYTSGLRRTSRTWSWTDAETGFRYRVQVQATAP